MSTSAEPKGVVSTEFVVDGMDCGDCARRMEERLASLGGIHSTLGIPASRILRVEYDPEFVAPRQMSDELGKIGYIAIERDTQQATEERIRLWSTPFARRTYASAFCFALGLALEWGRVVPGAWPLGSLPTPLPSTPAELLFLAGALIGGWNFFPIGVRAALRGALDMHVLMMLAIIGALGLGEPLEAAAIAFLFSLAELLEQYAVRRAHDSVRALMSLSPERATVIRDGKEVVVAAEDVRPGEHFILRTGERVPVDGTAVEGQAAIDASAITGESVPVECAPGDALLSGMRAAAGYLVVRADRPRDQSTLARIVRLVEEAQARKSPSERFVTRFARVYTPAVTIFAVIIVTVPTLLFGGAFELWFERALTLLVIACPCALVISTPVAVVSGLTAAARQGVLIKGGDALERLAGVGTIALDKKGTLTYGHPTVTDVEVWGEGSPDGLLGRAAAAERQSEHPLARAIVREARDRGIDIDRYTTESLGRRSRILSVGSGSCGTAARPSSSSAKGHGPSASSAWQIDLAPSPTVRSP
jgi:Cd2+/Zn2+-exporting ATPase